MNVCVRQWPKGASATRRSPRGHLGGDGGLIDEYEARGPLLHERLATFDPFASPFTHLGASALRGHQGFFYM